MGTRNVGVVVKSHSKKPAFLITIDTEGDNLWANPREITTRNARYLPRFQALCDRFGLKATWLTNYEMAKSAEYVDFARNVISSGTGEVGMHLHAWNTPPLSPLTADDITTQPYLIEYPEAVIREKIHCLTVLLEDTFGVKMRSHRAGRWSFDARYAEYLIAEGYVVDCSVTPHVSWRLVPGDPNGLGGTDYTHYPEWAYWMSLEDISRPAVGGLLEVPVTIRHRPTPLIGSFENWSLKQKGIRFQVIRPLRHVIRKLWPPVVWLRPNGRNKRQMLWLVDQVLFSGDYYAEFMLHSSELMPGGSPVFRTANDIERLYDDLEALFLAVADRFTARTMVEYYGEFVARSSL